MKKSRKLAISALLLVAFALQITGCSQKPDSSGSTSAPTSADSSATEKDYSKRQTISWAVYADQQITDINGDDFAKLWGDKFDVEWEVITMPGDSWNEKIRVWANSQDLPDVAQWDYNHVDASIYVEQELVKKLPEGWQQKWANLAKAYTDTVMGPKLDDVFGGTFFLPRPIFSNNKPTETLISHQGIYMRKDWVEAVGAEAKPYYSVEELLDLARLIKEKDPGKVGDKLIPIGNGINELPWYFVYPLSTYSMNLSEYYKDDSGKYQWGPASPETLQGLKYYQQAFDEGLLDPEFFTKATNYQEYFYTAGASAFCQAPGMAQVALRFANNFKANQNLETEDWLNFSFVVGEDGKYHTPEAVNFWASIIFSPSIDQNKLERVLDILDYSCTEQGQYEIRMGIENVDWKRGDDGKPVNLLEEGKTVLDKYYSIRPFYHNLYIVSDDFGLINPAYPQVFRDMSYDQYQTKYSLTDEKSLGKTDWDVYFYDSDAKRRALFNLPEEYAKLVVEQGDMETKWNAWVTEKMRLVQPVLDELNAIK